MRNHKIMMLAAASLSLAAFSSTMTPLHAYEGRQHKRQMQEKAPKKKRGKK